MPIKFIKLLISIGICLGAGFIGSVFTVSSIPTWYAALNKPVFSPPNWIFGPAWTILYIMMGTALYLVWISKKKNKQMAINLFSLQLGLNILWSVIFFGLRNPILAFVDIVALWVMIVLTLKHFYILSRWGAYCLIPYFFWVSFASVLNISIVLLN